MNSIKEIQSEMKDTLIEIKDNLHGDHSTVGEDKNQINNLNIRKQKKSNQNKKKKELGFWPRWRCRETHGVSSHNQKKDNKFKNKKEPELTENRTQWKSGNQGVKEETSIQSSTKGRDRQPDGEDSWQGEAGGLGEAVACGLGGPTFACR